MSVSPADVERIALLARLRLDPAELPRMTAELNGILEHVEELRAADVSSVEAFTSAAESVAPLRQDEARSDALLGLLVDIAPGWRDGFFTVPRSDAHAGLDDLAPEEPPR